MERAESEQGENRELLPKLTLSLQRLLAAAITRYLPRLAPNRIFRRGDASWSGQYPGGGAPMVGWTGWRNPATPRWHLWSAHRRKRSKPREPSPESAPVANVPAERDAVPAALQSSGNHVLEHAESDTREAVRNASSPTQQSEGMAKGGYALKYPAGLRSLTRRSAPSPKAPSPKAPSPKAPSPKAPSPKAPLSRLLFPTKASSPTKAPLPTAPSPMKAPLPKGKAALPEASSSGSSPIPSAPLEPRWDHDPAAAHAYPCRVRHTHTHIDIRVPDCVDLPCVDIHV